MSLPRGTAGAKDQNRPAGPRPIREIVVELLRRHHDVLVTADRLPTAPKPKGGPS